MVKDDQVLPRREKLAPHASVLIESMRDIGYSLQTAVADVIDNSITAGARSIEFLADTTSNHPAIGILDDGVGMSDSELMEAMRPGTRSPLETRPENDLGRFGLGLKTASFSQCRRLTVVTRKSGKNSCAAWDLDTVADTDEWYVEIPDDINSIPWVDKLKRDGTLVVWQKLDRLVNEDDEPGRENLVWQIDETAFHLERVFHRFMVGEPGLKRVSISLNGKLLEPFDPFHIKHPATIRGPEDVFQLGNNKICIQPITLPHHKKVSANDWRRYAGKEGYTRNQGFYLYREKRLIIHGTWFNLAKQSELTKLTRVRIDIPNGLDADWKIDVKKASAQLPRQVRDRLRRIIEKIGASSKRTYTGRGQRLTSDNKLPVWIRNQDKNEIFYDINPEHPILKSFSDLLKIDHQREFVRVIELIESTIPIDTLFADVGSSPKAVSTKELSDDVFKSLVTRTFISLKAADKSEDEIRLMMNSAEPFRSNWELADKLISEIVETGIGE